MGKKEENNHRPFVYEEVIVGYLNGQTPSPLGSLIYANVSKMDLESIITQATTAIQDGTSAAASQSFEDLKQALMTFSSSS